MIENNAGAPPLTPIQAPTTKGKRDRAEIFGSIVVFTPLIVTAVSFLVLAVPIYGIIGLAIFGYLVMVWWVFGVASLFVLFFALWGNRQAALYGALGMLESLVLGMIHSQFPGA